MKSLFTFNPSKRKWHLPVVASIAVGIPLLIGYFIGHFEEWKLAAFTGLSILYIQSDKLGERMMLLMTICFGIIISYAIGLLFSFNKFIGPIALGLLSFGVHFSLHKLKLNKPPGNFFFIMMASMAICTPFDPNNIPTKIGYVAIGAIITCAIALIYSLLTIEENATPTVAVDHKKDHTNITESIIFGVFICISLFIAFIFNIENPYWVPISCVAVMQGSSSKHTWIRGIQRIIGTLLGLALTWLVFYTNPSTFFIIFWIIGLQIIIELLIVRNYAIAVVFITILTILLAESGGQLSENTNKIFLARLYDILIDSAIGIIGGWFLFHEKVHYYTTLQLNKKSKKGAG